MSDYQTQETTMRDAANATILLAAGGTGGHLFPASALAIALKARGIAPHLATDTRGLAYVRGLEPMPVHKVPAATVFGSRLLGLPMRVLTLAWSLMVSLFVIYRVKPSAIVGFGGYPSFGPVMMGLLLRKPVIVHEQNAVLGRANRLAVKWGAKLATSFADTTGVPSKQASQDAGQLTGNPLRPEVLAAAQTAYRAPSDDGEIDLLVFGGSQGASIFAEIVPQALALLPEDLRRHIHVVHQVRKDDMKETLAAYNALGVFVELRDFFDDMPGRMRHAHLVISRGGASTIAELTALGTPALIVPLPGSLDQDQANNARALVAGGGAWMLTQAHFTAQSLAEKLADILAHRGLLTAMSAAAQGFAQPAAAEHLAAFVMAQAADAASAMETSTSQNQGGV